MFAKTLLAMASAALIGNVAAYQDAKIVSNNPHGVTYAAILPTEPFFKGANLDGNVVGSISATAADDGVGTKFTVEFSNLPKSGGPFIYHIHVKPAVGGNCTATLGHLDPTKRGDQPPCDASTPSQCQVGDLSGKYGNITSDPFITEFTDPFTSLQPGAEAFFGDRSFVLHYANTTRLTCADFHKVESSPDPECDGDHPRPTGGYVSPTASGVPTVGSPVPTVPVVAGAPKVAVAVAAPLLALGAAAMLH
ncbi:hypothetical protein MY4824_000506 [Beauveria thailandica]